MKKAILAVSTGTSLTEAEKNCILPMENAFQSAFPDRQLFRAFTSRLIRRKLDEQGVCIDSPEEALQKLYTEGFEDIIILSAHIIPGQEYDALLAAASGHRISEPLLACEDDLDWMAKLLTSIADEEHRPLLLMGHGSGHAADRIYTRLREKLPKNVFLACLKGEHTLDDLFPTLDASKERRITLMPLMLAAGRHAQIDLAGDSETSWNSILRARGFDVRIRLQGLGALPAVQQHFVEKAKKIL